MWKYEDGLYQPAEKVYVQSLRNSFDMWFDAEEELRNEPQPSKKQQLAWNEFWLYESGKNEAVICGGVIRSGLTYGNTAG